MESWEPAIFKTGITFDCRFISLQLIVKNKRISIWLKLWLIMWHPSDQSYLHFMSLCMSMRQFPSWFLVKIIFEQDDLILDQCASCERYLKGSVGRIDTFFSCQTDESKKISFKVFKNWLVLYQKNEDFFFPYAAERKVLKFPEW